jgi:Spy/CpxP family protein refolding chaperone
MTLFNGTGKRARVIGVALLLVTFVAGALAGAASERVMRADDAPAPAPGTEIRGGSRRLLLDEQFASELQLTPAQRVEISAIMERRDEQARNVWSEAEPRLRAVGEATRDEIKKVLRPDQVTRMESEFARRHAAWKGRHKCPADSARAKKE